VFVLTFSSANAQQNVVTVRNYAPTPLMLQAETVKKKAAPNNSFYGDWEPMMHGIQHYVQVVNQELVQAKDPAAADIPTNFREWTETDLRELAINRIGYQVFDDLVLIAKHAAKIVADPNDVDAQQAYRVLNVLGRGFDKMPLKDYYNLISKINLESKMIRDHYRAIDENDTKNNKPGCRN
jgi:hypothetical protein